MTSCIDFKVLIDNKLIVCITILTQTAIYSRFFMSLKRINTQIGRSLYLFDVNGMNINDCEEQKNYSHGSITKIGLILNNQSSKRES